MKPFPDLTVRAPLLPDEMIGRHWPATHADALHCAAPAAITFAAIPRLRVLLAHEPTATVAGQEAALHLEDAANEALPPRVRAQHFLLAGVAVGAAIDWLGATETLQTVLDAWRAAGGW